MERSPSVVIMSEYGRSTETILNFEINDYTGVMNMGENAEDKIKKHLSNFNTLESLMKNSIPQIYKKDQEYPDGYGIGWALRNSITYPTGWGSGYLKSLELNFRSIGEKIDEGDLIEFKKNLIDKFWETFSEIQTLGAIYRAKKEVSIERPLPDVGSERKFDFKISQPEIYMEVYSPFSKELGQDWNETSKWVDIGEELREKIFKKYKKKELLNITSCYPVFLIINTINLVDKDEIQMSEIINPTSKKYVFPKNVHCHGVFLYELKLECEGMNVVSNCIWSPNCPEELKEELIEIFENFK